jgi:hypothetical protein
MSLLFRSLLLPLFYFMKGKISRNERNKGTYPYPFLCFALLSYSGLRLQPRGGNRGPRAEFLRKRLALKRVERELCLSRVELSVPKAHPRDPSQMPKHFFFIPMNMFEPIDERSEY